MTNEQLKNYLYPQVIKIESLHYTSKKDSDELMSILSMVIGKIEIGTFDIIKDKIKEDFVKLNDIDGSYYHSKILFLFNQVKIESVINLKTILTLLEYSS